MSSHVYVHKVMSVVEKCTSVNRESTLVVSQVQGISATNTPVTTTVKGSENYDDTLEQLRKERDVSSGISYIWI